MNTVGLYVVVATVVVALLIGLVYRWKRGRMTTTTKPAVVPLDELGHELTDRVTLIQFSSAFCAPCRATRIRLEPWAEQTEGLGYLDIDAESHLELVRSLNILRTPTVIAVDAHGAILAKGSGGVTNAQEFSRFQAVIRALLER